MKQYLLKTFRRMAKVAVVSMLLQLLGHSTIAQPRCSAHYDWKPGFTPNSIAFHSSFNSPSTKYAWDFGDGTTSKQPNPNHTYAAAGDYIACLTVTDSTLAGVCTDTYCDTVHAGTKPPPPPSCDAHFFADRHGDTVIFHSAPNGPNAQYSWAFGDGNTSTQKDPTNIYAAPGTYYVCLTVTDSACNNTYCDSVRVGIQPPPPPPPGCNAHFNFKPGVQRNTILFFAALNPRGSTFAWDFGDGKTANVPNPIHTFDSAMAYVVCLTVTDSAGNSCNWCDTVKVHLCQHPPMPPRCDAHFKAYPTRTAPGVFQFRTFPQPPGTTYAWDFGNGTTSTDASPIATFDTATKAYYVCLTISRTSPDTCTDTFCDTVRLHRPPHRLHGNPPNVLIFPNPVINGSMMKLEGCSENVSVRIYDNMGRVVQQIRNVGDGEYQLDLQKSNGGLHYYDISDGAGILNQGKFIKSDNN